MSKSRREFLTQSTLTLLAAASASTASLGQNPQLPPHRALRPPSAPHPRSALKSPPPPSPKPKNSSSIALTEKDRAQAAGNWRQAMAPLYERRTGPRKVAIPDSVVPVLPLELHPPRRLNPAPSKNEFIRTKSDACRSQTTDEAIAFAPVHHLSRWIETRKLTSTRLTQIYLDRIERFNPKIHCIITLTRDHALAQAKAADAEIAAGHYRGPLHGIPWGAKDLLDTANIPTTWGAEPFQHRVPTTDATVTERLNAAGAVLIAKLSPRRPRP